MAMLSQRSTPGEHDRHARAERVSDLGIAWRQVRWQVRHEAGAVTCSALKHACRDVLRRPEVALVYREGSQELIRLRFGRVGPADYAGIDSSIARVNAAATTAA